MLKALLEKCAYKDDLDKFFDKHGKLASAVDSWDFSDCAWIFVDSTPAEELRAKRI